MARAQPSSYNGNDSAKAEETSASEAASLTSMIAEHGPAKIHKAFWQFCMGEDPDALLLRFLRARKWDVDRAFEMLAATLKWRIETNVMQIIAAGEEGLVKDAGVRKNFGLGKCYYRGTDKQGR
jgi:hypothetical protein